MNKVFSQVFFEKTCGFLGQRPRRQKRRLQKNRMFFDTRVYDGFTMPAGWYDALRVVIGEGKGHNWWCVLYPPLCISGAEKLAEELRRFSAEERALLESEPRYEVRFFLVELAEKIGMWFRSRKGG